MIHVEGMGALGALTAYHLTALGIPFSWHDIEAPVNAWQASTGSVYPAGDERSQDNLDRWQRWISAGVIPESCISAVRYAHGNVAPPHGGRYACTRLSPSLQLARAPAFGVNVAALVRNARQRFAGARVDRPPQGCTLLRAHGYTERLGSLMWGWSLPVQLSGGPVDGAEPLAVYTRIHRYQTVYAYPVPGTDLHLAGSSEVQHRHPHDGSAVAAKAFGRWLQAWATTHPEIKVGVAGDLQQGWRPRPRGGDTWGVEARGGVVTYPPLWHSGIRWGPAVVEQAVELGVGLDCP